MRKFLIMFFAVLLMGALCVSCESCQGNKKAQPAPVGEEAVAELNVDNLIAMDKQEMYINYGGDYRWFETCILLENYLDEENDGAIAGVSNVFQVVTEYEGGKTFDVNVVLYSHTKTAYDKEVKDAFWVGDYPMNDEVVKIDYKKAYDLVMAVNMPKPHSKHVVLRKEIGPVEANPQYIFGNQYAQIYVDAVTGEVSDTNPAFKGFELKMPLGEWP